MEFRELRTLCMVAKLGSLSRAAEVLSISQPSATRHLQSLQSKLGVRLVRPGQRPLQLTVEGESLARAVAPLIDSIEHLSKTAFMPESKRPVRVGSIHGLASYFLRDVTREFRCRYPETQVQVWCGTSTGVLELLSKGEVYFGLIPNPDVPAQYCFEPLFESEVVLLVPVGHPLAKEPSPTLEQIAEHPLIIRRSSPLSRIGLESVFRKAGIPIRVAVEVDNVDVIPRYVAAGIGVALSVRFISDSPVNSDVVAVGLGHLIAPEMVGVATIRGQSLPESCQRFLAMVKEMAERFVPAGAVGR